jgi:hypothetical protein
MKGIVVNWKTTATGLASWLMLAGQIVYDIATSPTMPNEINSHNAILALLGILGIVSRDFDKSSESSGAK